MDFFKERICRSGELFKNRIEDIVIRSTSVTLLGDKLHTYSERINVFGFNHYATSIVYLYRLADVITHKAITKAAKSPRYRKKASTKDKKTSLLCTLILYFS